MVVNVDMHRCDVSSSPPSSLPVGFSPAIWHRRRRLAEEGTASNSTLAHEHPKKRGYQLGCVAIASPAQESSLSHPPFPRSTPTPQIFSFPAPSVSQNPTIPGLSRVGSALPGRAGVTEARCIAGICARTIAGDGPHILFTGVSEGHRKHEGMTRLSLAQGCHIMILHPLFPHPHFNTM